MSEIFLKIVNMSLSASWIVLAVLLLRLLLKKAPKWSTVLLWSVVAVRLICPFSIESVLSLIPSAETLPDKVLSGANFNIQTGISPLDNRVNEYLDERYFEGVTASANNGVNVMTVLTVIWLLGIVLLLGYTAVSYIHLKKKVSTAVLLKDNILQSESVIFPFVLGIVNPKIYLPFDMKEQDLEYIIAHEQAHIRRKDHLWKPFGFLLLTLHWFNPLMWLGYLLLCRDIEFACDEKVIRELNTEQRADYSQVLLTCSVNRRIIAACPLGFGEIGVGNRVKFVLSYKKPAFWSIVLAIIVSIAVAVFFLTNPVSEKLKNIENLTLDSIVELTVTVWVSDGIESYYIGHISKDLLKDLSNIEISRREIAKNRGKDRDMSNTLVLQTLSEAMPSLESYLRGTYICFNSDFTAVWVNTDVNSTFSYKVKNPQKAKRVYNDISNYNDTRNGSFYETLENMFLSGSPCLDVKIQSKQR